MHEKSKRYQRKILEADIKRKRVLVIWDASNVIVYPVYENPCNNILEKE